MRTIRHLTTAAVLALALAGCATKKPAVTTGTTDTTPPTYSTGGSIVPGSLQDFQTNAGDRVYFGYDQYDLSSEARATLQRQAAWLNRYSSVTLTIEGHCDERGTREYNLALGARRAHAVKEFLASLGVSPSRLDTISYGKEHPTCDDSSEECWAQNRRGVSVIRSGAVS